MLAKRNTTMSVLPLMKSTRMRLSKIIGQWWMVSVLVLLLPADSLPCQIEYSDWLVDVFRRQGMSLDKRVGSYSSQAECEAALRQAVQQSGDPSLASNMSCVNCTSTVSEPSPQPAPTSTGGSGTAPAGPSAAEREAAAQAIFDRGKKGLLQSLKGGSGGSSELGLKTLGGTGSGLALKTGVSPVLATKPPVAASAQVQKEQDEFDRMQAEWLRKQQELIRQSAARDKKWCDEVWASIRAIRVPNPVARPKALDDLNPGDVLLIGPDGSAIAWAIKNADPLYRALDYFAAGSVSPPDMKQGQATHVLTFVKRVNGQMLFLDHTMEGSRVLDEAELMRRYGNRLAYIAKPQTKVDGRKLWEAAREAALQKKSDYGVFGKSVVCSERAAIAVARATGQAMDRERHGLGVLGPIDITPGDFFDEKHVGKFFLVSTNPILLTR